MMNEVLNLETLMAFFTLCLLEIVLGVDNIIFITILSSRLKKEEQNKAQKLGLSLAVFTRILLLLSLSWVIGLTEPFATIYTHEISGRDLILLLGGLFLIAKSTHEIHNKLEAAEDVTNANAPVKFIGVILQILLLDLVFSLDSVITAVGMVDEVSIMIAAVIVSTFFMIFAAKHISDFVDKHPSLKILALSFLILIGVTLFAEGMHQHFSKGYIYFAMAFSFIVESLNIRYRAKSKPVKLRRNL